MRKRVAIAIVCGIVLLALAFGCTPASSPAETQPAPTKLVIDPVYGKAKTNIDIYGVGFVPGENVRVEVLMSGVSIGIGKRGEESNIANEYGAFHFKSSIPVADVAEPGVYTVTAIGDKGSVAFSPLAVLEPK